jgi:hypothetical protein
MEEKKDKKEKEIIVLPDYMTGQSDHVKHQWRMWHLLGKQIDNHAERFYTISNQHTGAVRVMDCKANVGLVAKWAKQFNATDQELNDLRRICNEIHDLQIKKGVLQKHWHREVYGKKRGDKTILDVRYAEVIDLYSKFYSTDEIVKIIADKWGLAIKYDVVKTFFVENKEKIERKRADFVLSSKESRLATDAGRLEILSKLAWEMEIKFDNNKSIETSKELRAIVDQIRKEVKGEEIKLTIDGKIDINATIQANQTIHDSLQKLPINMIVIGLTAAKQGLNPASLIGSLANSYYSKFNGFNKLSDKKEIELPGQYIKSYNWDEIKRKNEDQIIDIEPIEVYETAIPEIKRVETKTQRQKMLEILEGYKNMTNN